MKEETNKSIAAIFAALLFVTLSAGWVFIYHASKELSARPDVQMLEAGRYEIGVNCPGPKAAYKKVGGTWERTGLGIPEDFDPEKCSYKWTRIGDVE